MSEHVSPEEKLLKLIRRKDKPASLVKDSAAVQNKSNTALSVNGFFRVIDKILIAGTVFLSVYIGYEFLAVRKDVNSVIQEAEKPTVQEREDDVVANVKPYNYYADVIQSRDIFESPLYGNNAKKPEDIKTVSSLPELTQNLKLVGIIVDSDSQAVIEDTQEQKTLFLHKGDQVKGATIDDIKEGKVILLFRGQRVELTP